MEIRRIKKSEWEKLRDFNSREYSPNHILTDKTYYDWQFDGFCNKDRDSYETLGIFGKNGDILGTFGRFSAPYNFYGKSAEGNCLCNLIVKNELRSLGYGYLLLSEASKLGDIAIDHSINDAAWPVFMKAGFEGENLKRYVLKLSKNIAIPSDDFKFEEIKNFDGRFDKFWQKVKNRYPISIERSSNYLNWRYAKNPFVKYKQFAVTDKSGVASFVILRIEEAKKENMEPAGMKVGRIVDFISSPDSANFAILKTLEFCADQNIDFVDFFESGNFHGDYFLSSGFADGDTPPFDSLPILLNPVSFKRTHLNFAIKKIEGAKLSDYYTVKSGGDMDRPR